MLRRDVGRVALLFTSVGSVIGSGWLLGALNATQAAGPAAIISWIIGAIGMLLLAMVHAELGGMLRVGGGVVRFPHYAFGSLVGFGMGWIYWLGSVTLAPIETEAALQYADKWVNDAVGFHLMHLQHKSVILTGAGFAVGAVLLGGFAAINLWGVRRLSESNRAVVWWKVAIPLVTVVGLALTSFRSGNLSAGGGFAPAGLKGILTAVASGGVVFSFSGFEQAIQFGGESKNPKRDIPFAVIGSMVVGAILYTLLELAFLGAVRPRDITHGWANLSFGNAFGPYAALAAGLGLGWLTFVLYVDAFLSPAGTGLVYTASSSRVSYGLARNGYVPSIFGRLDARGTPWASIVFATAVGLLMFLPFPGWQKLVTFITSATVVTFAAQCLALAALRRELPQHERPFRLPAFRVLAPVGFAVANLVVLFAGWSTVWKLLAAVLIGLVILTVSQLSRRAEDRVTLDWRAATWFWPWLAGVGVISYLSSFEGGRDTLPFGADMLTMAAFALVIYGLALRYRLPGAAVRERIEQSADEAAEAVAA